MYEACMKILWEGLISSYSSASYKDVIDRAENIIETNGDPSIFNDAVSSPSLESLNNEFRQYLDTLRHGNNSLSAFWMSYIDLVELLLNFLRASREGD